MWSDEGLINAHVSDQDLREPHSSPTQHMPLVLALMMPMEHSELVWHIWDKFEKLTDDDI
jgi:hypothetical protein